MLIRSVQKKDFNEVARLIQEAFSHSEYGYNNEDELVNKIRMDESYIPELELVAIENNKIVGHGLLSIVKIISVDGEYKGLVLAPLATASSYQRQGIGGQLLKELESKAKKRGYNYISVLGHSDYYSRFGYVPASKYEVYPPFEVPDENFMIKPLVQGSLDNVKGTIRYTEAFD